jgi:hypothetical protein
MTLRVSLGRRGIVGMIVVLLWLGGLGMLAFRELASPTTERLTEAGRRVVPGDAYYWLDRDGVRVGFVSSVIDTLPERVELRDQVFGDLGTRGERELVEVTSRVRLSRTLRLEEFRIGLATGGQPLFVDGRPDGDSALALTVSAGPEQGTEQRIGARGQIVPLSAVPLFIALQQPPVVGLRVPLALFDPMTMSVRPTVFRVTADSLFVVSDSAVFAESAQRWISAHEDTVRAWHVEAEGNADLFDGWVDAYGRLVAATYPGGFTLRRSSYGEAASNWRLDRRAADSLARRGRAPTTRGSR